MSRFINVSYFSRNLEAILPAEFYEVRQEINPKAGWMPMYSFALVAYIAALVSFVLLYIDASHRTYTDTVILSYDNTGRDGYTCQMISKVNQVYTEEADLSTLPSFEYYLVNVMEIASQYEHAVTKLDPCIAPQQYFPGTFTDPFADALVDIGGITLYGNDMAYATMVAASATPTIAYYNYTSGSFVSYFCNPSIVLGSLAVDRDGYPIYLSFDRFGVYNVWRSVPTPDEVGGEFDELIYTTTQSSHVTILNDNRYNIYLVLNTSVFSLDVYDNAGMTKLFAVGGDDTIKHAAVYSSGTSVKVYYINSTDYCISWENGVFTTEQRVQHALAIAVDGLDHLYFTVPSDVMGQVDVINEYDYSVGSYVSSFGRSVIAASSSGDRILYIMQLQGASNQIGFIYDPIHTGDSKGIAGITSDFAVGWFMCGGTMVTAGNYTPGVTSDYSSACNLNGVIGTTIFNNAQYMFTSQDAEAYAMRNADPDYCRIIYPVIGYTISDLPPYSCSRTIHPGFFTCLGTALANTQLLLQALIFLAAMLLTRLAVHFPPAQNHKQSPPAPTAAVEMTDRHAGQRLESGSRGAPYAGDGRYVGNHEVSNPLA